MYKTISINIYCAWYNTIFFIFFYFSISKALSDAIKRKIPTYLQKAIQDAKKSPFTAELEEDIKRAEIFLAKLNRMEGFLHPIAKLGICNISRNTLLDLASRGSPECVDGYLCIVRRKL